MKTRSLGLVAPLVLCLGILPASAQITASGGTPRFAPANAVPPRPSTYGGTTDSYVMIQPNQFTPFDTGTTYNDLGNGNFFFSRYPTAGNGYFYAGVNAPGGALLTYVE